MESRGFEGELPSSLNKLINCLRSPVRSRTGRQLQNSLNLGVLWTAPPAHCPGTCQPLALAGGSQYPEMLPGAGSTLVQDVPARAPAEPSHRLPSSLGSEMGV